MPSQFYFSGAAGDNSGGLLMVDAGDGYLADVNPQTGQTNWQFSFGSSGGYFLSDAAIGPSGIISVEAASSAGGQAVLGVEGDSGSLLYQVALPVSTQTVSGCLGNWTTNSPAGLGAPVVGVDGAVYLEVETFGDNQSWQSVPVDNGVDFTCELASESYSGALQLLRITPAGSAQYQSVDTTSNPSIALSPGEVIPDGNGGMLAYYASGGLPTIADVGSEGVTRQAINQQATYGQDNNMVLGDNNTAFVTDGTTVTALRVPSLQVLWNYASTGGTLSFVAATAGGGVTINDSQQGVIELDAHGNASAAVAALQGATPFELGSLATGTTNLAQWASLNNAPQLSIQANLAISPAASAFLVPQGGRGNERGADEVPFRLDLSLSDNFAYQGEAVINIYNKQTVRPQWYGYARFAIYTLKDNKKNKTISSPKLTATESVEFLGANPPSFANVSRIVPVRLVEGQFTDALTYGNPSPPAPVPGNYLLVRQHLSVKVKSRNYDDLRVNCVDFEYSDLTLTDITRTPSTCVRR